MVTKAKRILSAVTSAVIVSTQLLCPAQAAVSAADTGSDTALISTNSGKTYPTPYFMGSRTVIDTLDGETVPLSVLLDDEDMGDEPYFKSASILVTLDSRLMVKNVRKGDTDGTCDMTFISKEMGYHGEGSVYNISVQGQTDVGRNGVFATFDVILPSDTKPGDVFWMDVCRVNGMDSYWSGSSDKYDFNDYGFIDHIINHAISGERSKDDPYLAGTGHEGYVTLAKPADKGDSSAVIDVSTAVTTKTETVTTSTEAATTLAAATETTAEPTLAPPDVPELPTFPDEPSDTETTATSTTATSAVTTSKAVSFTTKATVTTKASPTTTKALPTTTKASPATTKAVTTKKPDVATTVSPVTTKAAPAVTETPAVTEKVPAVTTTPPAVINSYLALDKGMTWTEAEDYCEKLGGHLAVITSPEEMKAVLNAIQVSSSQKAYYWLGGRRNDSGDFEWITGEPMVYTNWCNDEPDNPKETCLMTNRDGAWYDSTEISNTASANDMGFICEWESGAAPVIPPEPSEPPKPRRLDIDGEMKVTEMNIQQIKDAGINLDDPSNYHVFKYETRMEFEASAILINKYEIKPVNGNAKGSEYCDIYVNGESVPVVYHTETEHEEMFMIIRGECKWLKEFYDVELLVFNRDDKEELTDCEAILDVPSGLTLMNCQAKQELGTLQPRKAMDVHWYVRGDKAGDYVLTSVFKGKNRGKEFKYDFKSRNTLHVYAGNALKMTIELPRYSAFGTDYMATITFENVSNKPIYNVEHTIFNITQGSKLTKRKYINGQLESESVETHLLQTKDVNQSYEVGQLNPGDKIVAEITIHDIWKSILQQEIEDKKLAADWIVLLTCWSKNPYIVGFNKIASIYSTILENIVVVHVLKNVSVATLPGSTTQIPYEVIVIDNSDEHAHDLVTEVAKDLGLDLLSDVDFLPISLGADIFRLYDDLRNAENTDDVVSAWTDFGLSRLDETGVGSAIKTLFEDYYYRIEAPEPGADVFFYTVRRERWPATKKAGAELYNQDFDIEVLSGDYTVDEEGKYVFTTGALVKVTPKVPDIDAYICVKSSDGKQNQNISVHTVDKHECSGKYTVLAPPSDGDGAIAACFCDTCHELLDCTFIHKDATAMLRNGHSYQDIRMAIEDAAALDDKTLCIFGNVDILEDTVVPDDVTLVISPDTVINEKDGARLIDDGDYKDFSGFNYDLSSNRPAATNAPVTTAATVPATTTETAPVAEPTTTSGSSEPPLVKPEVTTGDINDDGMIDSSDASLILEHYASLSTGADGIFSSRQKAAGDVDSNGKIDSSDASVLLGYYAYISTNEGYITIPDFLLIISKTE